MKYQSQRPRQAYHITQPYWQPLEYWEDDEPIINTSVIEQECDTFTGLYDHNGDELHRMKEPMGFVK